jgi:cyclase
MKLLYAFLIALVLSNSVPAETGDPFQFEFEEIATGVWAGVRPDGPRFPVMGNTTFVISDAGVVVFDGGGVPVMAEQIIDKIRSITDRPVTHVVISHWHGDHNFGIYRFLEEFPNVQVIAQAFTDRAMNGSPMDYIDNYPGFGEQRVPAYKKILETGKDADGNVISGEDLKAYQQIVADADVIDREFKRVRLTKPNLVVDHRLTIHSGKRTIELISLGHGNTEGELVMWLEDAKILASGDLIVLPSPYAFNVPPRAWANTLHELNRLDYQILVPGHGAIQHDRVYVDLVIEVAEDIANQRDAMIEAGVDKEDIADQLDFSGYAERFTGGDAYLMNYYTAWFEQPLRKAAVKELSGEPMKKIDPPKDKE